MTCTAPPLSFCKLIMGIISIDNEATSAGDL